MRGSCGIENKKGDRKKPRLKFSSRESANQSGPPEPRYSAELTSGSLSNHSVWPSAARKLAQEPSKFEIRWFSNNDIVGANQLSTSPFLAPYLLTFSTQLL